MVSRYNLFLDDERMPAGGIWRICRSYDEFVITCMTHGCPKYISFDHDLGNGFTGMDCARWLVTCDMDNPGFIPSDFSFYVHSQNPIGAENIRNYLNLYLGQR